MKLVFLIIVAGVVSGFAPENKVRILTGHRGIVETVAFSSDGRTLASGSMDNAVKLWDVQSAKLKQTLTGHQGWGVSSVAFAPNGIVVASAGADGTVRLWDAKDGRGTRTIKAHKERVSQIAFSPDGSTLASAGIDRKVRLWDTKTGKLKRELSGHTDYVWSVAISPDGQTVASGGRELMIKLWDATTGRLKTTLTGSTDFVSFIVFSPDGKIIATPGKDEKVPWNPVIQLWDVQSRRKQRRLGGHKEGSVHSVAFSPDGTKLASGSTIAFGDIPAGGELIVWNTETGKLLQRSECKESIYAVAFSPDGKMLAGGSSDMSVKLWEVGAIK